MPLFLEWGYMKELIELIKSAKSVIILPHISADGDAVASCQAMRCALKQLGIKSVILAEEEVEPRLEFISGEVEVFDEAITEHDTVIVLDCGDIERIGKRSVLIDTNKPIINIDHHRTNTRFGTANLVIDTASATGEVLFLLFSEMGIEITDEIAGYLYTAICSDTGSFAYSNVSPKTLTIAAELISHNINHAEIARLLFDCVDIETELLKAELTKNIHSYYDGKVRTVAVSKEFAAQFDMEPEDVQGLVDIPRRIRGTEIAVALKELDGKIRISLRSNGDADVSEVALKFGGGGHIKASGCGIKDTDIDTAEKLIVEACGETI